MMPSGKLIVGMYMVDIFCLGLKQTLYKFAISKSEYDDFLQEINRSYSLIECNLNTAHNIIYGAIDFAEELGFKPQEDFKITQHILNTELIDEDIDNIEFGKNGKPLYCEGPYDDTRRIIGILEKNAGSGNYDVISSNNGFPY